MKSTILLSAATTKILWVLGAAGWVILLLNSLPRSASESFKEALRQRDDHLHGEIWDLHFCTDQDSLQHAQLSYAESTIIRRYDTTKHLRLIYLESPSIKPSEIATKTRDTFELEITPEYTFLPGRGVIMEGLAEGPFVPPANLSGDSHSKSTCSGRVGVRGYFPDSLRVEIIHDSTKSPAHWFTGIKKLRPNKEKASNRMRITIVHHSEDRYSIQVSERPRQDMYSCTMDGDECGKESWIGLFWRGLIP